jgi:hypothetical protein
LVFETGSCCVAQACLKLEILLPQPPECWKYRHDPPYLSHGKFLKQVVFKSPICKTGNQHTSSRFSAQKPAKFQELDPRTLENRGEGGTDKGSTDRRPVSEDLRMLDPCVHLVLPDNSFWLALAEDVNLNQKPWNWGPLNGGVKANNENRGVK